MLPAHLSSWAEKLKCTLPVVTSLDSLRILMQGMPATWTDFNATMEIRRKKKSLKIELFIFLVESESHSVMSNS